MYSKAHHSDLIQKMFLDVSHHAVKQSIDRAAYLGPEARQAAVSNGKDAEYECDGNRRVSPSSFFQQSNKVVAWPEATRTVGRLKIIVKGLHLRCRRYVVSFLVPLCGFLSLCQERLC